MSTDEAKDFLQRTQQNRGYTLEMHRIMAEADLEWAEKYHQFIEATYTGQRLLDRKTKELLPDSGGSGAPGGRGADTGPREGCATGRGIPTGDIGSAAGGYCPHGSAGLPAGPAGLVGGDWHRRSLAAATLLEDAGFLTGASCHEFATRYGGQARQSRRPYATPARRSVWQRRQLDNQSTCEQSPLAAGNVDITQRHPQSPSPRLVLPPSVPAAAEGLPDAIRPAPQPALPSAPHCRWQSRSPIVHQPGSKPGTPNLAGTLSRPKCRPESRRTAGTHRVEVALPADPSKRPSLVHRRLFCCERPQGEVNRFSLGRQLITPHHLGTRPIIYVYICAYHTPTIHH